MRVFARAVSACSLLSLLSACGGGGEDGIAVAPAASAAMPTPTPTPTPGPVATPTPSPTPTATPGGSIWQPKVSDTWQWQLRGSINASYAVRIYDIDLVDAPQATIDTLRARGVRVVCYFSAGSSEDFRADYGRFTAADKGNILKGFDGERWLDIRSQNVRAIMRDRITLAASKRCDGVEPDNVDGYTNDTGFALTGNDQLAFNRFLAAEAHGRGLAVALKNDLDQIPDLVASFEFAVNEQCHEFKECEKVQPFIRAGKPVLNAEYQKRYINNDKGARDMLCTTARAENLRTLVLPLELNDSFRDSCD